MLIEEIKMIAGVVTDDMDYIGYLLLKDGSYFKQLEEEPTEVVTENPNVTTVSSLEDWFNSIGS